MYFLSKSFEKRKNYDEFLCHQTVNFHGEERLDSELIKSTVYGFGGENIVTIGVTRPWRYVEVKKSVMGTLYGT